MTKRNKLILAGVAASVVIAAACGSNPATGNSYSTCQSKQRGGGDRHATLCPSTTTTK